MSSSAESSQGNPSPPQTRRGADTAERILDAAESCFATRGYAGTTLRDVANLVGIRIPSLYNHFPNKAALYAAVLERGMTPVLELLSSFVEAGEATHQNPDRMARALMDMLLRRPNLPRLIQYELLAGGDNLATVVEDWLRPTFERGLTMLQASPAARRWRPDQLPLLLLAVFHVVIGHFTTTPLLESLYPKSTVGETAVAGQTEFFGQLVSILSGVEQESSAPI
jgi:TetR/AcrR family transcriptional regulator